MKSNLNEASDQDISTVTESDADLKNYQEICDASVFSKEEFELSMENRATI